MFTGLNIVSEFNLENITEFSEDEGKESDEKMDESTTSSDGSAEKWVEEKNNNLVNLNTYFERRQWIDKVKRNHCCR